MIETREYKTPAFVWIIMAVILILAGLYVLFSADEIATKISSPLWFVKIPAFVSLIVGVLVPLRILYDAITERKTCKNP